MQRRVKTLFDHLVATGAAPNDAAARALASAQAEIDGVERPPASAPTASTRAPTAAEPVATTPNAASSPSATLPGALAEAVGGSQSDDEAEAAYGAHAQFWVEDDADPEGHYYASQGASAPAPTAQFTRTVRKQWQLLQAGLPVAFTWRRTRGASTCCVRWSSGRPRRRTSTQCSFSTSSSP